MKTNPVLSSPRPTVRPASYPNVMPPIRKGVYNIRVYDPAPPYRTDEQPLREDPVTFDTRRNLNNYSTNYPIKTNFGEPDQKEFPPQDPRDSLYIQQPDPPIRESMIKKFSGMFYQSMKKI